MHYLIKFGVFKGIFNYISYYTIKLLPILPIYVARKALLKAKQALSAGKRDIQMLHRIAKIALILTLSIFVITCGSTPRHHRRSARRDTPADAKPYMSHIPQEQRWLMGKAFDRTIVSFSRAFDLTLARYHRGRIFFETGSFEAAIKDLRRVLDKPPRLYLVKRNGHLTMDDLHAESLLMCGTALLNQKRLRQAVADLSKVLALEPANTRALAIRSKAWMALGKMDLALADINNALSHKPNHSKLLFRRGVAYFETKRYQEALADWDRVAQIAPKTPRILTNQAVALYRLKRYDEAAAAVEKHLAAHPEDKAVRLYLGKIDSKRHNDKKAVSPLEQVVNQNPPNAPALFDLAHRGSRNREDPKSGTANVSSAPPTSQEVMSPLSPAAPSPPRQFIATTTLSVRDGPAIEAKRTGLLQKGSRVQVIDRRGDYAGIGQDRWVASRYLMPSGEPAAAGPAAGDGPSSYLTTTALIIRSGPSVKAERIGRLSQGNRVQVIDRRGDYAGIGQDRWVASRYLMPSGKQATAGDGPSSYLTTTALIIRSGPSVKAERIGLLPQGNRVQVIDQRGDYAGIGHDRWVASRYLMSLRTARPQT